MCDRNFASIVILLFFFLNNELTLLWLSGCPKPNTVQ